MTPEPTPRSGRPARRARALARALGLAVALLGATVFAGWALGVPWLITFGAGNISPKANVSLCLLALGLAVRWSHGPSPRLRRLSPLLAVFAAGVGGLTLSEHVVGWDLGIDQLLFAEPPGAPATASPGRMGPPASTSFLLLGIALALRRWAPRRAELAELLAVGAALVALLSIVGYALGAHALFGVAHYTGIALPTALGVAALAIGVLATARRGPLLGALGRESPGARIARRSLVAAVAIPLTAGWLAAWGLRAGLYDGAFAVSALVLVVVLSLALTAARDALRLDHAEGALQASHAARGRAELELRRSEERFRRLVEVSSQIVWAADAHGEPLEDSPSWRAFTGLPGPWEPRRFLEAIHPDDRVAVAAAWRDAVAREDQLHLQFRQLHASGTHRHVECRAIPIRGRDGAVREWIGMTMDVDDRVRAEQALRESDRRKSEFLGVLSHELRNPLAAIRSALHLLGRASAGAEHRARALEVLERQTGHLVRIVDDLLDVTRISRGKIELRRTTLDAAGVARRTCDDLRPLFERAGIELSFEAPAGPVWILADETRLAQIIGNLLQNAAKFTPRGGATLVAVAAEGDEAVVKVRDSGIGLAESDVEQVFEPFAQMAAGSARAPGGLGLGLAIVKQLVQLHGGTVRARSEGYGTGTEFEIRLPATSPPAAEAAAAVTG